MELRFSLIIDLPGFVEKSAPTIENNRCPWPNQELHSSIEIYREPVFTGTQVSSSYALVLTTKRGPCMAVIGHLWNEMFLGSNIGLAWIVRFSHSLPTVWLDERSYPIPHYIHSGSYKLVVANVVFSLEKVSLEYPLILASLNPYTLW